MNTLKGFIFTDDHSNKWRRKKTTGYILELTITYIAFNGTIRSKVT